MGPCGPRVSRGVVRPRGVGLSRLLTRCPSPSRAVWRAFGSANETHARELTLGKDGQAIHGTREEWPIENRRASWCMPIWQGRQGWASHPWPPGKNGRSRTDVQAGACLSGKAGKDGQAIHGPQIAARIGKPSMAPGSRLASPRRYGRIPGMLGGRFVRRRSGRPIATHFAHCRRHGKP